MSRIPISVKIVEDELFTSWMETVARLNVCETTDEKKQFYDLFFGCNLTKSGYLTNLQDICRDNTFVPDVLTILKKHMSIYAFLPLVHIGVQGKKIEYCLRNPKRPAANVVGWAGNSSTNRICPICAKNDIKKYGRKIIHVPHQLGIATCWKHNVKLVDCDSVDNKIEYGTLEQNQIAVFMYELYKNPVYTTYEQVINVLQNSITERRLSAQYICKELENRGYITKKDIRGRMHVTVTCKNTNFILALIVWMFGTADNFRQAIYSEEKNIFHAESTEDFELLEEIDIVSEYKCKKCGHIFYMHPTSVSRGTPCPKCNDNMSEDEVYARYLKRYFDDEYEFVENNKIRHKPCGTLYNANISSRFWTDVGACKVCNSKIFRWQNKIDPTKKEYSVKTKGNYLEITHIPYQHSFTLCASSLKFMNPDTMYCRICDAKVNQMKKKRIGEINIDKAGRKRILVDYRGNSDVDIKYMDDSKIYTMSYQSFRQGRIPLTNHIGEKKINRQGQELEIVAYRSLRDLDVKFPDGAIVEHSNYEMFKIGTITKEERVSVREQRKWEESRNRWGERMIIIEYRTWKDMDVQFDDGTIVTTNYPRFKRKYNLIRKDGK